MYIDQLMWIILLYTENIYHRNEYEYIFFTIMLYEKTTIANYAWNDC